MEVLSKRNIYQEYFQNNIQPLIEKFNEKLQQQNQIPDKPVDLNSNPVDLKTNPYEKDNPDFLDTPIYKYIKNRIKNTDLNIKDKKSFITQIINIFKNEHLNDKQKDNYTKRIDALLYLKETEQIRKKIKDNNIFILIKKYSDSSLNNYINKLEKQ